jgi:hypothetical protein
MSMKTFVGALLALSVLAVAATAPARAEYFHGDRHFDAQQFFDFLANTSG